MNWLDTQTKEILQKNHDPKLAPAKAAEFSLVLIHHGTSHQQLIRAICRINECSESEASKLACQPAPLTIHSDLTQEEALFGQFELICCDAIGVFIRSEILEQNDKSYIQTLFQTVQQSPEFMPTKIDVLEIPATESGERFVDQFLGAPLPGQKRRVSRFSVWVPFKKARIMNHWATRIGARIKFETVQAAI